MKIVLYISMIALSAILIFVLPKMIEKKTYIACLAIIIGVMMAIPSIALPIVKKYVKPYHERQATAIEETIRIDNELNNRVKAAPIDSELYNSVREIMAQRNMAVADILIDYAINSLGKGEHTAFEIANRVDEIRTGKINVWQEQPATSTNNKDLILIAIISLIIVMAIGLTTQISHGMLDMVIGFHIKYNAENIHRQPVKFFIENQNAIKLAFTYLFFFGSFLILWGAVFKTKI